ncbi:hypothetical protein [Tessaracoccus antarcticus]|uniref:PRC-barrel domain containing protein n=1 Tax=Tessaracoccus antarcticus TaxID=2479848 RepID=A0A3M0G4P3_9ACTN|nr:hypothetical protein [Tessaracoccus antarcticus]RMB59981.1 hypothetical protein EAX62_09670 [Tessaracoccus antarcticus]
MTTQEVPYMIGATITGDDGPCGTLDRVVLDPVVKAVTHVVVRSPHHLGSPRLVPVELLELFSEGTDLLRFHGTVGDFFRLAIVEETHFIAAPPGFSDYDQALLWPYFEGKSAPPSMTGMVTEDHLPMGEVDIRRGDTVHATDGEIGLVQGLVVNTASHVTHLLLQEGHFFGRKEVSIPISAVTNISNGVELSMSRDQIRDLPAVEHEGSGT